MDKHFLFDLLWDLRMYLIMFSFDSFFTMINTLR